MNVSQIIQKLMLKVAVIKTIFTTKRSKRDREYAFRKIPAYGQTYRICGRPKHQAIKCRNK